MKIRLGLLALVAALCVRSATVYASGPIGIYGIVERVVFEPNDQAPERIQIWGAFAYGDGGFASAGGGVSSAKKGYLYFSNLMRSDAVLREWRDLKAIAGTGQAVGFETWIYIGAFPKEPDQIPPAGIYQPSGGSSVDLRVRPESQSPESPSIYVTNAGMIKLAAEGSHASIVKLLKDALRN